LSSLCDIEQSSFVRLFFSCAALVSVAGAHDIITTNLTYTRDISRIFAKRCVGCHGAGSSIPLTNYAEVRPWAVAIKEQVLSRSMPPWGAVKGFGEFSPDNALTQEEIMIIAAWVVGGAPEGSSALLSGQSSAITDRPPHAAMRDALVITTSATLQQALSVIGIRPLQNTAVDSARIIALLPDGGIAPLIWLYNFDPKWKQSFHFREPIKLPAGTRIESSATLRFALEVDASSTHARRYRPFTGTLNTTVFTTPFR
jgi:hypothetical protein